MERGLTAGDAYALQYIAAFLYMREDFFFGNGFVKMRGQNERRILAKRAAQIAAAGKYRAGQSAGIVQ